MSRGASTTKDCIKTEDSTHPDDQFSRGKNKKDDLSASSCFEKLYVNDHHQKAGFRQTNDLSQTIGLFRKYLLAKAQPNLGKTNMEESEAIKRKSPCSQPLLPPNFSSRRQASFLEQRILHGFGRDATEANSADSKSSKTQLTIFYAGTVNVYDNIPAEKAQAIMLLAGESSLSKPLVSEMPKPDRRAPLHPSNLQSLCKLQADLPIARKRSLQHFLAKRHQRIIKKSPYVPLNKSLSLSSFPSSLGHFFPVSSSKFV